ncbi:Y+L amino acid transporter 2-like [Lineus longissimus]|uniref:Y+L amino acid transporter 2-like n=1 Tax=Lineus longissimus TaxID=88925 RepID=UPI002B4D9E2E
MKRKSAEENQLMMNGNGHGHIGNGNGHIGNGDNANGDIANSHCKEEPVKITLKRHLGLRNGIGIIVGIIIGSGIFVSPKGVLHEAGSVGAALCVWAACGFVTLIGALSYAELGASIQKSGGVYSYTKEAFGDLPAFLVLWINSVIRFPTGNTVISLTFSYYIMQAVFQSCQPPDVPVRILSAAAILVISFLNCVSVKYASRLQDLLTGMKIIALAVIILTGIVQLCLGYGANFKDGFEGTTRAPGQMALAFYSGLFSFSGWESFNYVTEEIKRPERNLPLALWISIPLVTGIYVMANVAYFTVLTPEAILGSHAVAVTFADRLFGVMAWVMPVLVAFSCLGSLNGCVLCGSRMFFIGAREEHFPDMIALVNIKCYTPVPAVMFTAAMSLIILTTSDVYSLITYFEYIEAFMLALPVMGLLYLRWKRPDMPRPVKVNLLVPVMYLVVAAFLLIFPWFVSPLEAAVGVCMVLSGVPVYFIGVCWKKPKAFQTFLRKQTILIQKVLYCVKVDKFEDQLQ